MHGAPWLPPPCRPALPSSHTCASSVPGPRCGTRGRAPACAPCPAATACARCLRPATGTRWWAPRRAASRSSTSPHPRASRWSGAPAAAATAAAAGHDGSARAAAAPAALRECSLLPDPACGVAWQLRFVPRPPRPPLLRSPSSVPPPLPFPACSAHTGAVWSLAPLPDSSGFVSGSADHDIKFWEWGVAADPDTGAKQLAITNTRCAAPLHISGAPPPPGQAPPWAVPSLGTRDAVPAAVAGPSPRHPPPDYSPPCPQLPPPQLAHTTHPSPPTTPPRPAAPSR